MNKKYGFIILVFLFTLSPNVIFAANHYIRTGAAGNGSGLDWTNACTDILAGSCSTLVRGDVYYIASGKYGPHTCSTRCFDTATSGTTPITIKGATVADHGTATGWQVSYSVSTADGGSQAHWANGGGSNAALQFRTSYWVWDGSVGAGWPSITSQGGDSSRYGFIIDQPAGCVDTTYLRLGYSSSDVVDHSTFTHFAIVGCGSSAGTGQVGINLGNQGDEDSNDTFSYFFVDGTHKGYSQGSNSNNNLHNLIEHAWWNSSWTSSGNHGIGIITFDTGAVSDDLTVRYSVFLQMTGTAVFEGEINGWKIYGNVFDAAYGTGYNLGNGVLPQVSGSNIRNTSVYNNTTYKLNTQFFWDCNTVCGNAVGNVIENNIFNGPHCDITINNAGGTTEDYNTYFNCSSGPNSEAHSQMLLSDPTISGGNGDYHLALATNDGNHLAAPYNLDPDGNIRGNDGVWDRGAFEFVSGTTVNRPQPPQSLVVSVQ